MNTSHWHTIRNPDNTEMRVFTVRPATASSKLPAVIVLQEIFGINAHIRDVTARVAALGYVAAAPDLFHRSQPGFESGYEQTDQARTYMQAYTEAHMETDIRGVHAWLSNDTGVDNARIASIGFCMGGKASFLANALLPLKAAISYYGGGIAPGLLARAAEQHGPILMFWGGQDAHIGADKRQAATEALTKANKPYINVEFSEAGHGFFCNERKSYHAASARQSWALATQFFKDHLENQR